MKYQVYFEIGNKKMQMAIKANSVEDAKYRLLGRVNFLEVRELKEERATNPIEEFLGGFAR